MSWHATPIQSLEDARNQEFLIGSPGPSASDSIHSNLLNRIAGTKVKTVMGYESSTQIHLAMERGEVQGRCGFGWDSILSRYRHYLNERQVVLIAQFALDKHPDLPEVPFIGDLAKTDEDRQMIALLLAPNKMGRPFFAPPEIPAERVMILRRAFDATAKDTEFLADAEKQKVEISAINGEEVEALVKQVYQTPRPVIEATHTMLGTR